MIGLALLACSSDPLEVVESALGRELGDVERAQLEDVGTFVMVLPDQVVVGQYGQPSELQEVCGEFESVSFPLTDGRFPDDELRGRLHGSLYEVLLDRAECAKQASRQELAPEFQGRIRLVVDRRSLDLTLTEVMFTAGQAQFGNMRLIPVGPTLSGGALPPPPLIRTDPDPSYRPSVLSPVRIGRVQGRDAYTVDDRSATIRVDSLVKAKMIPTMQESTMATLRRSETDLPLYRSYTEAAAAARNPILPSLEMLLHVSKHLDDELMADLQRVREPVKQAWVAEALQVAEEPARSWFQVAADLGAGVENPDAEGFLANPLLSRPIGIYGESESLGRVFQRDRWLAQSLERSPTELRDSITNVMKNPGVAAGLQREREHRSVWTNPPGKESLETGGDFVIAPCRSHEATWVDSKGGTAYVPHPMEQWTAAIESGETSIALSTDSGWYDRVQWALEPLLTLPDEVEVGESYRIRLRKAFMAGVALRRETQVKDLELPAIGSAGNPATVANVAPLLRVEPVPTHYERSGAVYTWLLEHALSRGELPEELGWKERVSAMRDRYEAMAALSRVDLGQGDSTSASTYKDAWGPGRGGLAPEEAPRRSEQETAAASVVAAADWLEKWQEDPILGNDVRVVVPAGMDATGATIGWAILGVHPLDLVVDYTKPPVVQGLGGEPVEVHLTEARYTVLVPVFREVRMGAPLSRSDFRALGDANPVTSKFIAALAVAK